MTTTSTKRLGPNQRRVLQLLETAPHGLSNIELAEQLGLPYRDHARKMMEALNQRKLVHITKWLRLEHHLYPVWQLGEGINARRPKSLTVAQASARYRTRKKALVGEEVWRAVARAREHSRDAVVASGKVVWTKQDSWQV